MSNTTPSSNSRPDGVPVAQGKAPPPPPPLPPLPQRYGQRAATAIARLAPPWLTSHPLTSANSNSHSHADYTDSASHAVPSRPTAARYRSNVRRSSSPASSRSAVHKTGIAMAALDISPYRTHAVLAGREILKTVRVGGAGPATEDVNIRSSIIAYASAHSTSRVAVGARHRDQLAANDVRWSSGNYDTVIATAAAGGRIVIYDLNRASLELTTLLEHARQVHKLAFSPFKGELLLSGSQDGGIKLWDIRTASKDRRSQLTFNAHDQGIRDVKWSTNDGVEFATGTEGGVVQRWDMRRQTSPIIKIKAHNEVCHSIDYHPSGRFIASGGAGKVVKVWDTTRPEKRQNPTWSIHAPQSILNVRWRPSRHAKDRDGELRALPSAYIATSYDADPRIHIWDFRRPGLPFQEIDRYDSHATDMLWHSDDLLWSVGSAGIFTQTDLNHVPKPFDRLNVNSVALAPDGSMTVFSDRKKTKRLPLADAQEAFSLRTITGGNNGEKTGSSVSADGSLEEGSLLASTLRRRRKKAATQRLLAGNLRLSDDAAFGGTEASVNLGPAFSTTQMIAHGQVRGIFDAKAFQYLAEHYERPPGLTQHSDLNSVAKELERVFLRNSHHAVRAGDHGLAHIWRILAWAVRKELEDWVQNPEAERLKQSLRGRAREHSNATATADMTRTASVSTARGAAHLKSPLSVGNLESGSNVPTPRVRPVSGTSQVPILPAGSLGDEPVESDQSHKSGIAPKPLPPDITNLRGSKPNLPSESTPRIQIDENGLSSVNNHDQTPSEPIPIPQTTNTGEVSSPPQPVEDNDSVPSFSDLEQQLAVKRAALTEYRHTPRPIFRLGAGIGEIQRSSVPHSPTHAMDVPRPGIDRHDSGESFNLLSESVGSHRTSLNMSSFEDSPVKRRTDDHEFDRSALEHEIEDRLLLPVLGKQAAAEESEKLLEEMTSSGVLTEPSAETSKHLSEAQLVAEIETWEARRPSHDLTAVRHADEIDKTPTRSVSKAQIDRGATDENAQNLNQVRYAVYVDHAHVKPWHASSFLSFLLSHYLDHLSFVQLPTFLALYLHPIYPSLFPTLESTSSGISSDSVLSTSRLDAVILSYHAQLVSLQHYVPAAQLRRDCVETYPTVSQQASPGSVAGRWCRNCQKPSKGEIKGLCSRCKKFWGGCTICGDIKLRSTKHDEIKANTEPQQTSTNDYSGPRARPKPERTRSNINQTLKLTTASHCRPKNRGARWTYCSICGHGGHASCLDQWFRSLISKGGCAVPDCPHACAPGPLRDSHREARAREHAEEKQLRRGTGVLRDERVVKESKAVREARNSSQGIDAEHGSGLMVPVPKDGREGTGATGIGIVPMESVREPGMLESDRVGIGMGRGRGRWRSAGASGIAATGRRGGRNSVGSVTEAGSAGAGSSIEGSTGGSSVGMGVRGGILAGGGGLGRGGEGLGHGHGHRRVTIVEPRESVGVVGEEDELAIEFATESSVSSSVP